MRLLSRAQAFAACTLAAGLIMVAQATTPAHANIFTRLLREAGEAGGRATRHGVDVPVAALKAARFVASLPKRPGHLALAAHATPDGHWKFVNSAGDVFTAATPEEMIHVVKTLSLPGAPATRTPKLALYFSEETLFEHAHFLDKLPKAHTHHIVVGKKDFQISLGRTGANTRRLAHIRKHVVVPLTTRRAFDEAIWQLSRPLRKADIRVLSLHPGARATLKPVPRFDKATRHAMVDVIDPDALPAAMSAVRGQTLLISGEIRANTMHFAPNTGPARTLNLNQLRNAAKNADVNLIILRSRSPRQPGGRNWLWQTVEVGGLKDALNRATFADFLHGLGAAGAGTFRVTVTTQGRARVILDAITETQGVSVPYTDVVGDWLSDAVSNVTGNVATTAVRAYLRDKERQAELDLRILPGIPSMVQIFYLASMIAGVMAWSVSRQVWAMIWRREQRQEYGSTAGYTAARVVKAVMFWLVFLPVLGLPLLALSFVLQTWTVVVWIWTALSSPIWIWRWLRKNST